jgi:TonB family protein
MRIHSARLSRRGVALWMLCGFASPALAGIGAGVGARAADGADLPPPADMQHGVMQDSVHDFNIPAQPLAAALNRYADISGQSTVFSSEMAAGRTSSAVQGRYASENALRLLLDGTGLIVEKHPSSLGDIFLLKENSQPDAPRAGVATLFSQGGYPGLIQARVWQALCADTRTAPGRYRILFRFEVDAAGRLADARLLSSTGNNSRDAALLDALRRVQVDVPPPAAVLQQPLTMLLLPDDPHAAPQCDREAQ